MRWSPLENFLLMSLSIMPSILTGRVPPAVDATVAPSQTTMSRSDSIALGTATGALHGTLLLPQVPSARVPVVLIIAGSGPTDRDGNSPLLSGTNNSLKLLAEGLAVHGIASVRYDKRGIAASRPAGTSEAALRFDTYIDDAAAWIALLRRDPRFSSVGVI